jgi:hypothetical protein
MRDRDSRGGSPEVATARDAGRKADGPVSAARRQLRDLSLLLRSAAALLGFGLAVALLSGDAMGRVNLLYLLLLFVLLPLLLLAGSAMTLAARRRNALIHRLSTLPLWPAAWHEARRTLGEHGLGRHWLLLQSQACGTCYSIGLLTGFLLMLLFSDISFVWRSTLLEASDLEPLLRWLAQPWWWWQAAQPAVELLAITRDSRLTPAEAPAQAYGQWWRYLLMAQLVYNLAPRALGWAIAAQLFERRLQTRLPTVIYESRPTNTAPAAPNLPPTRQRPEEDFVLLWLLEPSAALREDLGLRLGAPLREFSGVSLTALETDAWLARWQGPLLVVIDAMEAPLAQLHDMLQGRRGYLLPLGSSRQGWSPAQEPYLGEWRRFASELGANWQVLLPTEPA